MEPPSECSPADRFLSSASGFQGSPGASTLLLFILHAVAATQSPSTQGLSCFHFGGGYEYRCPEPRQRSFHGDLQDPVRCWAVEVNL